MLIQCVVKEIIDSINTSEKSDTKRYYHHHHYQAINSVITKQRQQKSVVYGKIKRFIAILVDLFVVVDVVFVFVFGIIKTENRKINLLKIDFKIV
jgi:hypothetical protein